MNSMISTASLTSAVAVPATSLALTQPDTDAELLALGAKFEAAWSEVRNTCGQFDVLHNDVLIATEEACPNLPDQKNWTPEDAQRYWQAFCEASEKAGEPYRDADRAQQGAYGICDNLARAIARIAPCTIAGAGVRARIASYAAPHWWNKPLNDLDWPEKNSRLLIEALCAAAGLPTTPDDDAEGLALSSQVSTPSLDSRARLEALWTERTALARELHKTQCAATDAEAKMPEWAQRGPQHLRSDGTYSGRVVGWPRIEDAKPPEGVVLRNVRPSPTELEAHFGFFGWSEKNLESFERAMASLNERRARQEAERAKVGLPELEAATERLCGRLNEIDDEIEVLPQVSPTKAAVMFMIGMTRGSVDESLDDFDAQEVMARGTLPLIRPYLSGLIADHVDDLIKHPEKKHSERAFWPG